MFSVKSVTFSANETINRFVSTSTAHYWYVENRKELLLSIFAP